jgi:hypothetical protein
LFNHSHAEGSSIPISRLPAGSSVETEVVASGCLVAALAAPTLEAAAERRRVRGVENTHASVMAVAVAGIVVRVVDWHIATSARPVGWTATHNRVVCSHAFTAIAALEMKTLFGFFCVANVARHPKWSLHALVFLTLLARVAQGT